jgi:membrane carboxypeptidase/penicillin-binding protein
MADIMSDDVARAPAFGANTDLTLPDRKVAAKTGTTNGFKDNWTMGFHASTSLLASGLAIQTMSRCRT